MFLSQSQSIISHFLSFFNLYLDYYSDVWKQEMELSLQKVLSLRLFSGLSQYSKGQNVLIANSQPTNTSSLSLFPSILFTILPFAFHFLYSKRGFLKYSSIKHKVLHVQRYSYLTSLWILGC